MKHKRNILTAVAACTLLLAMPSCQGPSYITEDPNVLLNYQKDPSIETLTDLSKAYLNTINQNRKQGKVQPSLYCDYAVTLYLLGKPEAAEGWFNKEVATFPYTATYVKQLRDEMEIRLNGDDPNRNRRYTVDDINSMDEIAVLRPTENREASKLTRESVQESERISREAVRGLDKPLTKEEERAIKREQRDNLRQEKASQQNKFTAPGADKEKRQNSFKEKAEQKEEMEKRQAERAAEKAAKKAAKESGEKTGLMERIKGLFSKEEKAIDSNKEAKQLEKEAEKAAKAQEKAAKEAAKKQEQEAKAAEKEAKRLAGMSPEEIEKEKAKAAENEAKAAEKAEKERLKQEAAAEKKAAKAEKEAEKKAAKELKEAEKAAKKAAKDKEKEFDDKAFDEAFD